MKLFLVPLLMLLASCLMALAWLGHLRFRDSIGFWTALAVSWAIVLPEYALNVAATRYGHGTFSGAQMATFHLAFGVVAVAFVSRFVLGERLTTTQLVGFALLALATVLICQRPQPAARADASTVEAPAAKAGRPVASLLSGGTAGRG